MQHFDLSTQPYMMKTEIPKTTTVDLYLTLSYSRRPRLTVSAQGRKPEQEVLTLTTWSKNHHIWDHTLSEVPAHTFPFLSATKQYFSFFKIKVTY